MRPLRATLLPPLLRRGRFAHGALVGVAERRAHAFGAQGKPCRGAGFVYRAQTATGHVGVNHASRAAVQAVVHVRVLPDVVVAHRADLGVARVLQRAGVGGDDGVLARSRPGVRPVDAEAIGVHRPRRHRGDRDDRGDAEHNTRDGNCSGKVTARRLFAVEQRRALVNGARAHRGAGGPGVHRGASWQMPLSARRNEDVLWTFCRDAARQ